MKSGETHTIDDLQGKQYLQIVLIGKYLNFAKN